MTGLPSSTLTRGQAVLACLNAGIAAAACAGLCVAAIVVPAPAAVAPLVAGCCVCLPVVMSWQLPRAVTTLRSGRRRSDAPAIAELRRHLAKLPEVEHPLGH